MSSSSKRCLNNPNNFCYICREYAFKIVEKLYQSWLKIPIHLYFGMALDKNYKSWAPDCICKSCIEYLRLWESGKRSAFKFGTSTIWREPKNHLDYCYFCSVNINGIKAKDCAK